MAAPQLDALVCDAHLRCAVHGLRALGRAGVQAIACGPRRDAAGLWSRHAAARALAPRPATDAAAFAGQVGRLAARHGPLVVYPCSERSQDALLGAGDALPAEAILPLPAAAVLEPFRDKRALARIAREAGLAAPEATAVGTAAELLADPPLLPAVLKPARGARVLGTAVVVEDTTALRRELSQLPADEPLLVQPRLSGPLTVLAVVLDRDGAVAARFQHVARRTWPIAAGSGADGVSVLPDRRLVDRVAEMLRAAGFWGLAQVDLMPSPAGPALLDVNFRFYDSMALAYASGVDLATTWHRVVLGERAGKGSRPLGTYRTGVAYRWLEADASAALAGAPDRLLRRVPRPRTGAMWAADDPVASALLAAEAARVRLARRLPGASGGA